MAKSNLRKTLELGAIAAGLYAAANLTGCASSNTGTATQMAKTPTPAIDDSLRNPRYVPNPETVEFEENDSLFSSRFDQSATVDGDGPQTVPPGSVLHSIKKKGEEQSSLEGRILESRTTGLSIDLDGFSTAKPEEYRTLTDKLSQAQFLKPGVYGFNGKKVPVNPFSHTGHELKNQAEILDNMPNMYNDGFTLARFDESKTASNLVDVAAIDLNNTKYDMVQILEVSKLGHVKVDAYMIPTKNKDGSSKTLFQDGNGEFRNLAGVTGQEIGAWLYSALTANPAVGITVTAAHTVQLVKQYLFGGNDTAQFYAFNISQAEVNARQGSQVSNQAAAQRASQMITEHDSVTYIGKEETGDDAVMFNIGDDGTRYAGNGFHPELEKLGYSSDQYAMKFTRNLTNPNSNDELIAAAVDFAGPILAGWYFGSQIKKEVHDRIHTEYVSVPCPGPGPGPDDGLGGDQGPIDTPIAPGTPPGGQGPITTPIQQGLNYILK